MVQIALGAFSTDKDNDPAQYVEMWSDTTVWTEDFLGKVTTQPTLAAWYQHWGGATWSWNTNRIEVLTARGEVPVITWEAWDPSKSAINNTDYHLSTINAGNHDAYIDDWGTKAAAYGKPILIRLFHEFNFGGYPWGIGVVGQTAADLVSAWQRIVNRVRAKGAYNVKWVWCPLAEGNFPVTDAYPGDSYVDYIGLDGYNNIPSDGGWQTPADVFDTAYAAVTAISSKPFFYNEVGCMETGGDKAAWITDFFNRCQTNYPRTRGICWFDSNFPNQSDWRINSSVASLAAWNDAANNPEYRGNIETGVQFVTHTATTSATAVASLTANVPASLSDDVLIMSVGSSGIADTNIDTGTWTKFGERTDLNTTNSGTSRLNLYWKRSIGASEPTTVGLSATGGVARTWDVDIQVWRGCRTGATPIESLAMEGVTDAAMTGTISLPSILTTDPDRRAVSNVYFRDGSTAALAGLSWTLAYIEEVEATTQVASTNSQTLGVAHSFVPDEGTTSPAVTLTNAQDTYVAATFALIPAPVGLTVPTLTETLRPTAVSGVTGLTPTDSATATALIDDDPDDTAPTDWMVGTDPSGSTVTHGVQEPSSTIAAVTGFNATTWANPANIADTSDTTVTSFSVGANNVNYGGYFSYEAADFTGIPSTATITALSLAARMRAGTSNRGRAWLQLGTANGSLIGSESAINAGNTLPNALTTYTLTQSSFGNVLPTRADLVTGTFGIRVRVQRTNTTTFELARLALTITYVTQGSTTPVTVTVALGNPTRSLKTSTTVNGEMRAKLRKKGTGNHPPVTIELREAGVLKATLVNAQSVTSTASQIFSAAFDQGLITNANDVEFRISSPGVSGALVEVGAIEWVAQVSGTVYLLNWDPSAEPDLAGYNVYRRTGTKNLLGKNASDAETALDHTSYFHGATGVSRDTTAGNFWQGVAGVRLDTSTVANDNVAHRHGLLTLYGQASPVASGTQIIGSAYVKVPSGVAYRIAIRNVLMDGTTYHSVIGTSFLTGTGAWERVSTVAAAPTTNVIPAIEITVDYTANIVFYADAFQIELGSTVTAFEAGADYAKINTSLVTTADYFDTDVVEGQGYLWRVSAVDTSLNESWRSLAATVQTGTTFNLSLVAVSSTSALLVRQARVPKTRTLAATAVLTKRANSTRIANRSLSALVFKQAPKALSATSTALAILSRQTNKPLSLTRALSAVVARVARPTRQATQPLSATSSRQTGRTLFATRTLLAALPSSVKSLSSTVVSVLGAGATLSRRTNPLKNAALTSSASLARQAGKSLPFARPVTAAITRATQVARASLLASSALIPYRAVTVGRVLTQSVTAFTQSFRVIVASRVASLTPISALARHIGKQSAAIQALTGYLTTVKAFVLTRAASLTGTATLTRAPQKPLDAPQTATATSTRVTAYQRALAAPQAFSGALTTAAAAFKTNIANQAVTGALSRSMSNTLASAATFASTLVRSASRHLGATTTPLATIARQVAYQRTLIASSSLVATMSYIFSGIRTLVVTQPVVAAVARQVSGLSQAVQTASGYLARSAMPLRFASQSIAAVLSRSVISIQAAMQSLVAYKAVQAAQERTYAALQTVSASVSQATSAVVAAPQAFSVTLARVSAHQRALMADLASTAVVTGVVTVSRAAVQALQAAVSVTAFKERALQATQYIEATTRPHIDIARAATLSLATTLARTTVFERTYEAVQSLSATVSNFVGASKYAAAATQAAATMSATVRRTYEATLGMAASFTKSPMPLRVAVQSLAGSVSSYIQRSVIATQAVEAYRATVAGAERSFSAALNLTGVVAHQIEATRAAQAILAASQAILASKPLGVATSATAYVARALGIVRTATLSTGSSLAKMVSKTLVAVLNLAGVLTRHPETPQVATQGTDATLTKQSSLTRVAEVALAASLIPTRVALRAFFATQALATTLVRTSKPILYTPLSQAAVVLKGVGYQIAASRPLGAILTRLTARYAGAQTALTATLVSMQGKAANLIATVSLTATTRRAVAAIVATQLALSPVMNRVVSATRIVHANAQSLMVAAQSQTREFVVSVEALAYTARTTLPTLPASLAPTTSLTTATQKAVVAIVLAQASVRKNVSQSFRATLTAVAGFIRDLLGLVEPRGPYTVKVESESMRATVETSPLRAIPEPGDTTIETGGNIRVIVEGTDTRLEAE